MPNAKGEQPEVIRGSAAIAAPSTRGPGSTGTDFQHYLNERARIIEQALARHAVKQDGPAQVLFDAMRYSLFSGGKRLRPIVALAACEAVGGEVAAAMRFACAIEMIHTYSMIHDDLPSMDDDDLRRGKPTNHKVYGEAIAILAGDALLTDAFGVAVRSVDAGVAPKLVLETISELAEAAGSPGMVAGQTVDLVDEGRVLDLAAVDYLHSKKTGALFMAAAVGGGRLGGGSREQLHALRSYGSALGLAFQLVDDLLDVEASSEEMGKRTHKDQAAGKATYPAIIGVEESRKLARILERRAQQALAGLDQRADPLRQIATFVVERKL